MIVLLPHTGFLSETSRALAIYQALRARGADVRIASHGGTFDYVLTDAGIQVDALAPRMSHARCVEFISQIPGVSSKPAGNPFSVPELREYSQAEAAYFKQSGARAVVTGFMLSTLLSSRLAKIPLITEHGGSLMPPMCEAGLCPVPTRSPIPYGRFLPKVIQRFLANKGPARVTQYCTELNEVAAELGVDSVPSLAALLMGDLTLVTDVPEVTGVSKETLESWRPGPKTVKSYRRDQVLRYVGPLYAKLDIPVPEHVERFLSGEGPVVYVAMTSVSADLITAVVKRVAAAGARVLVAATSHALEKLSSDRVCVGGVLPSHLIFPRVALGVIAGGQGSVQTALAGGTPFIGVPLQPEQDWNVVTAERLGAAERISPDDARTEALTKLVQSMLNRPPARAAAERVAAIYAKVDGPARCAEEILNYLKSHTQK
jgi:UDP:flavonoid glycosyltransferase YjiC (YdhE family)